MNNYLPYLAAVITLLPVHVDARSNSTPVNDALDSASIKEDVPARLLKAICFIESSLNPKAVNKYDGGSASHGLCQIKLATARGMGFNGKLHDLYNPSINARYSAKYLHYQLSRYDGDWVRAVSAYNRGSAGRVIKNTRYVNKVLQRATISR